MTSKSSLTFFCRKIQRKEFHILCERCECKESLTKTILNKNKTHPLRQKEMIKEKDKMSSVMSLALGKVFYF